MTSSIPAKSEPVGCRKITQMNLTKRMQYNPCPWTSLNIHDLSGNTIREALPAQILFHPIVPLVPDRLIRFLYTLLQFDLG